MRTTEWVVKVVTAAQVAPRSSERQRPGGVALPDAP